MKHPLLFGSALLAIALLGSLTLVTLAFGENAGPNLATLRGADIQEEVVPDAPQQQITQRFRREYRQQPPLIPHKAYHYEIDLKVNQCLGCHDWTNAVRRNAPTLSMTHYQNREGQQLDKVAGSRWFCNQCHVPQVNAPALVDNTFTASSGR